MGGAFGFGKSSSKSQAEQESFSGVDKANRTRAAGAGLDLLEGQGLSELNRLRYLGAPLLNLSPIGLQSGTQRLFETLLNTSGRQNFTNASASSAQRGRVSPNSLASVIADTKRRTTSDLTPIFAPIAESNQRFNVTSPVNFQKDLLAAVQGLAALFAAFTRGGEGKGASSGSSDSFNFNISGGTSGNVPGATPNSGTR